MRLLIVCLGGFCKWFAEYVLSDVWLDRTLIDFAGGFCILGGYGWNSLFGYWHTAFRL